MSAKTVLITRAQPAASDTAEKLQLLGYEPILSPVLETQWLGQEKGLDLAGVDALIFTSARGVRGFTDISDKRDIPAWCVGEVTAGAALEEGLCAVQNADGNADDLFELISARAAKGTHFLHMGNEAAAGDLAVRLSMAGFPTRFTALYRMKCAQKLSHQARRFIQSGKALSVLIHSAKGADCFAALSKNMPLSALHIAAISPRAAAPLRDAGFGNVSIAARPNEAALLARLAGK